MNEDAWWFKVPGVAVVGVYRDAHGYGVAVGRATWAVRLGWGHDAGVPLSCWPSAWRGESPKGHPDAVWSWCGFYVGVTTKRGDR